MIVEWRQAANEDLDAAIAYLEERNPQAAYHLADLLIAASRNLAEFPNRGRPGRILGTRELVAVAPFILVYVVDEAAGRVVVERLWHAAQHR